VLPTYRIEPPDVLRIEATHVIPRAPYRLRTLDAVGVAVQGTLEEEPLDGVYQIEPGGMIRFGFSYGSVSIAGLTLEEAERAIEEHLKEYLREPVVTVTLVEMASLQTVAGEHLVGPDGTVQLGVYGAVPVAGLTLAEAKAAIETQLAKHIDDPEVTVDVFSYNSKRFYVILQGAGLGDVVYTFPVTGNETVLDAVSQINGLQQFSSKNIWIARPSPQTGESIILPVDWKAVTALAETDSNYQLLPGDRLFVAEDKQVAFNTALDKFLMPWERIMAFSTFGVQTVSRFSGNVLARNSFNSGAVIVP
jgi:protein involved in polysaccharide export with SLBB domain